MAIAVHVHHGLGNGLKVGRLTDCFQELMTL